MSDELDGMWREVSTIMGEHTCKEIIRQIEGCYALPAIEFSQDVNARRSTLGSSIPQIWTDALTRSIATSFKYQRFGIFKETHTELRRRNKRTRRKHRATFRRRKRGLV